MADIQSTAYRLLAFTKKADLVRTAFWGKYTKKAVTIGRSRLVGFCLRSQVSFNTATTGAAFVKYQYR